MTEGPPADAPPPGGATDPTVGPGETVVARPGSHRARRSPLAAVIPVLVVAAAVVAVGVGVYGWLSATDTSDSLPSVTPVASTPTGPSSPSPTPSPSPTVSTSPSPTDTPSPTTSAKPSPTPKPTPTKTSAPPVSRTAPVVVRNQTSITGLAAQVGSQLERLGWQVVGVGNWRGNVPETTVYYPPGQQQQAQQLARDLGADRIRPRVSGMRTDVLTVILNSRPS